MIKWFIWHGNISRADQVLGDLQVRLDTEKSGPEPRNLAKYQVEFAEYIRVNADPIPNYSERHRAGETISTSFVESTVNQMVSKPVDRTTGRHADMVLVLLRG
ncbi:MAG: hypothetical protein ACRDR6_26920 [Pseudonocardiaceae bacterium]